MALALAAEAGNDNTMLQHSSVIQSSTDHSNNNPGVFYCTLHCGADIKFTVASLGTSASASASASNILKHYGNGSSARSSTVISYRSPWDQSMLAVILRLLELHAYKHAEVHPFNEISISFSCI